LKLKEVVVGVKGKALLFYSKKLKMLTVIRLAAIVDHHVQ